MTKFFHPAISIKVKETSGGIPEAFICNGRNARVRAVNSQWRIREGWWHNEVSREYFQLETSRFVCMIYRDLLTGEWFLQRIYD